MEAFKLMGQLLTLLYQRGILLVEKGVDVLADTERKLQSKSLECEVHLAKLFVEAVLLSLNLTRCIVRFRIFQT